MNIKIVKLPDHINPDKLIEDEVLRRFEYCPFCNAAREDGHGLPTIQFYEYESWYGYYYGYDEFSFGYHGIKVGFWKKLIDFLNPKEKKRHWAIIKFHCRNCNAEWFSPPFPTHTVDSLDDLELNDFKYINYTTTNKGG